MVQQQYRTISNRQRERLDTRPVVLENVLMTARQPDSPTARQPDSPTARQPDSPTARQPDSPTARQPDSPTARQPDSPILYNTIM